MTQMGLDYQKHMETKRHNLATEGLQSGQLELDTRKHVETLPIEQQKADATTRQSFAATRNAATSAAAHQHMVDNYEREYDIRNRQAQASAISAIASGSQSKTAAERLNLDKDIDNRNTAVKEAELEISRIMADLTAARNEQERKKVLVQNLPSIFRQWYATQELGIDQSAVGKDVYFLVNGYIPSALGENLNIKQLMGG